jgi:phosphate transport system permease protein
MSRQWRGRLFVGAMMISLAVSFGTLGWLLIQTLIDGLPGLDGKLLTEPPSSVPEEAGARPAILATLYMAVLLLLMTVPIGVGTAIYLEEYANKERWYNRLLELNIQNLAAVPAIVYGILGLAFIVRGIGLDRVLLAGAMILTLVVLPTVIIASREAIRAVPDSIRQGGYLALSRAVGETAPLLLVGALTYVAFDPTILGPFTALPVQIYQWIRLPDPEFQTLAAAAIIVLLAIVLGMNALAIFLRNRYRQTW